MGKPRSGGILKKPPPKGNTQCRGRRVSNAPWSMRSFDQHSRRDARAHPCRYTMPLIRLSVTHVYCNAHWGTRSGGRGAGTLCQGSPPLGKPCYGGILKKPPPKGNTQYRCKRVCNAPWSVRSFDQHSRRDARAYPCRCPTILITLSVNYVYCNAHWGARSGGRGTGTLCQGSLPLGKPRFDGDFEKTTAKRQYAMSVQAGFQCAMVYEVF